MAGFVHSTAIVEDPEALGAGSKIWHFAHVRKGAKIGSNTVIGKGVYVDTEVVLGSNCKIQNNVSLYRGVLIEDGVFIGPHVCFTNDLSPRAITAAGVLKEAGDWHAVSTTVKYGASIGANSTIVCGTTIGSWSLVGAGSIVTRDVPPHALVFGGPARIEGIVGFDGQTITKEYAAGRYQCRSSGEYFEILPEWEVAAALLRRRS